MSAGDRAVERDKWLRGQGLEATYKALREALVGVGFERGRAGRMAYFEVRCWQNLGAGPKTIEHKLPEIVRQVQMEASVMTPTKPDAEQEKAYARLREAGRKRIATRAQIIEWVADHIDDEPGAIDPDTVPSAAAVAYLRHVQSSPLRADRFWQDSFRPAPVRGDEFTAPAYDADDEDDALGDTSRRFHDSDPPPDPAPPPAWP